MRKLKIFFLFILAWGIPSVLATDMIGESAPSHTPLRNNSIEQDFFFDGANYKMITSYGNYIFLQPNNIMEYHTLDGEEVIDKAVWVLQHNTSGSWLPLLDFENQRITHVNETVYEIAYDVMVRDRGPSRAVGGVNIGFYSSGYSMNEPKIIVNFTKGSEWGSMGLGSFRWIWDIIPNSNYRNIVKEWEQRNIDLSSEDYFIRADRIYFTDNFTYSESEEWIGIDVSDFGEVDIFGGDESFFNSRGIILIFPEGESYIDPVTIANGLDASATEIEQQRKVFRNPRGQEDYYAIFKQVFRGSPSPTADTWSIYTSPFGANWEIDMGIDAEEDTNLDWVIWEDSTNDRLIMYVALINHAGSNGLTVQAWALNDTETEFSDTSVTPLWESDDIITPTDDGIFNPNIELDNDGYIWISWTDEYTSGGQQRNDVLSRHTNTTLPLSSPFWSNSVKVYDGSTLTRNPTYNGRSELAEIYATADLAIIYIIEENAAGNELMGRTMNRASPLSGTPTLGTEVVIEANNYRNKFSSIAETEANSDVFIILKLVQGYIMYEWDISANTSSTFDSGFMRLFPAIGAAETAIISINKTANPDELIVAEIDQSTFPANSTLNIFVSNVSVGDFILVHTLDLPLVQQDDWLSGYWISNESIIVIWTNETSPFKVHFYEYPVPPPIIIPEAPELLFGAGFNGSNPGFVELYWNHSLDDVTDFEVHNSSDGISFLFLDNVTLPFFNDTGLTQMDYIYYRVRARIWDSFREQFFNSSWSNINLERVFFERGAAAVSADVPIFPWIAIAIILSIITYLLARER